MGMADKPNRRAAAAAARELLRPKLDRITDIAEAARTIELAVQARDAANRHIAECQQAYARARRDALDAGWTEAQLLHLGWVRPPLTSNDDVGPRRGPALPARRSAAPPSPRPRRPSNTPKPSRSGPTSSTGRCRPNGPTTQPAPTAATAARRSSTRCRRERSADVRPPPTRTAWTAAGPAGFDTQGRGVLVGGALGRGGELPAAQPDGEAVGGGEEGDVDVGELVDEPQPETGARGTAGGGHEPGERVGRSGAVVVHPDHEPIGARPDPDGDGPPPVQVRMRTASETRAREQQLLQGRDVDTPCKASATQCRVLRGKASTSTTVGRATARGSVNGGRRSKSVTSWYR